MAAFDSFYHFPVISFSDHIPLSYRMSRLPPELENFEKRNRIIVVDDDNIILVPSQVMDFEPEEKDEDDDNTTPAELGKLCRLLQLLIEPASIENAQVPFQVEVESQLSKSEPQRQDIMILIMVTTYKVIAECKKQSKKMLASCLPPTRSGPLPSLVVDKIAEFLIEDEDVWTKENCKFENAPSRAGKRHQWTNQVYNELAEIYDKLKDFKVNKHSQKWEYYSVFEAKRTRRRLSDGRLFG